MAKISLGSNVRKALLDHFARVPEATGDGMETVRQLEQRYNDFVETVRDSANKDKISQALREEICTLVRAKAQRVMDLPGAKNTQAHVNANRLRDSTNSRDLQPIESTLSSKEGAEGTTQFLVVEQLFWEILRRLQKRLDDYNASRKTAKPTNPSESTPEAKGKFTSDEGLAATLSTTSDDRADQSEALKIEAQRLRERAAGHGKEEMDSGVSGIGFRPSSGTDKTGH